MEGVHPLVAIAMILLGPNANLVGVEALQVRRSISMALAVLPLASALAASPASRP
ncbi:MAG: hypothetical protein ACR2MN_08665 [Acidimicrobiales bacterium]